MFTWDVDAGTLAEFLPEVLCVWREARNGGLPGMQAVAWVIKNRAAFAKKTTAEVVLQKWQFSSMTAPNDPGMVAFPKVLDPIDFQAFFLAFKAFTGVMSGSIPDPTSGSRWYYAESMSNPPSWSTTYTYVTTIGGQRFYKA